MFKLIENIVQKIVQTICVLLNLKQIFLVLEKTFSRVMIYYFCMGFYYEK